MRTPVRTRCLGNQGKLERQSLREPPQSKCRRRHHNTILHEKSQENAAPQDRNNHFARACAVEMYLDMPQEPFYARILRENDAPQDHDNRFARACTVELHVDSHKNHCMREFTGKKPQLRMKHPDQAPALTLTARTLSVDALFGE